MKLLYCEDCGDIVAPSPKREGVRKCRCGNHAVWWDNPSSGQLRVCCCVGHPEMVKALKGEPHVSPSCWVIGLTNLLLHFPLNRTPNAEEVQEIIDKHPDSYIFKQTRSMVIRIRVGQSGDTAYAPLPEKAEG